MSDNDTVHFTVDGDGGFYVTISDELTVYEAKDDAVADIQDVLDEDEDAFIAEMAIQGSGDDVEVNLEQVSWQQIIKEMSSL